MSKRAPNVKATTKTSSVSSKASSKTSSSGSQSRSVSKSRPVGKSPTPSKAVASKNADQKQQTTETDNKAELTDDKKVESSKDVNNNLVTPNQEGDLVEAKSKEETATPAIDQKQSSLDKQVPSRTSELEDIINEKVKIKKSSNKRSNSKQDIAQLLRRKSLTPSAKLIILCRKGDWLAVETFLKQVDKKSIDNTVVNEENNWTPLMYASRDNRVAIVERLIQLGFNVNVKADGDITALHVACANAREDTIKLLLMKRIDTMVPAGVRIFKNF